jgi:hypothetical protein
MAIIRCSECGRSISDRAAVCLGCGAPLASGADSSFNIEPPRSHAPPLTRTQLRWRLGFAILTFASGIIAASLIDYRSTDRIPATLTALLLIGGVCWLIVAIVQNVMARR